MKVILSVVFVVLVGALVSCDMGGQKTPGENGNAESGTGNSGGDGANVSRGATPEAPGSATFNVRFEKGKTSSGYEQSVGPGGKHTYQLGALKGQAMKVGIKSLENYAMFTVFDPVGNKISDGESGNTAFEKVLPADGIYKITVAAVKDKAKYRIDFSVAAKESVDDEDESADDPGGLITTVRFAKGKSSATYEDAVIRAERNTYVLEANSGQTLSVEISSLEDNAVFQISGPKGYLPGAEPGTDRKRWTGKLPQNGKYKIIVGGTRGNATYKVKFGIK